MCPSLGVRVAQANKQFKWTIHELTAFPGILLTGRDYYTPGERVLPVLLSGTVLPGGRDRCRPVFCQSVTRLPFVSRFSIICTLSRPLVLNPVSWITWSALPPLPNKVMTVSVPEAMLM